MFNKKSFWILFLTLTWCSAGFAGNTGKIAGGVVDKQSGDPLIGVNILIKDTDLGTATDEDGFYFILQIPPGTYVVEASYLGYHTITIRNVRVTVDLTTRLNIEMESTAIEGPTVEVIAEYEMVQKDVTSTRRIASREQMEETPGFESSTDIFLLQGGSVVDVAPQSIQFQDGTRLQVRDESLKDIHVRGGRGGEILFIVDGVPVTHPIYGGRDVLDLNVVDVQEMELLTGAFNAEYGEAQSGVVNITTRKGKEKLEGGVEYKNSESGTLGGDYDTRYGSFYLSGPEPLSNNLLTSVGLDIPGKMYFFLSGNMDLTNTPYNNGQTRDDISVLGLNIPGKQDNAGNLNFKVNWELSNKVELVGSYHGSWKKWSNFDWLWRNYPDHMAEYKRSNQYFVFRINHTLSKSTFYKFNLGYLSVDYKGSLNEQAPPDYWVFFKNGRAYDYESYLQAFHEPPDSLKRSIESPERDQFGFFDRQSYQAQWRNDLTRTYTARGDLTSQIHPEHMVKTGFTVQYNDLKYVDIQDGGVNLSYYGDHVFRGDPPFPKPNGPFPEFGKNRWVFHSYPLTGSFYIQDKFEKETFIINAGVRFDWFTLGPSVFENQWQQVWKDATGLETNWDKFDYKFSPRFGISFPISERTVVFFSYGHFIQLPEMQFFYRDPYTGGFTGNPHLDYEQTILYEFGFTHQLARNWAIDIKSYTKDISQQVGTTRLKAALGLPVDLYDNKGYARARGLEFELNKRYSNYTSGKLTYTVQWANGYSSSAFEDYIRSLTDFPNPIRERRLDWDIRHQLLLQANLTSPPGRHINLFGLKLPDNWKFTVLSRYSSGQPYTPGTFDPVVRQKEENLATGPPTMTTDVKFSKTFNITGVSVSPFIEIYNIFDRRNVQAPYGFNPWTGEPYKYGDLIPEKNQYYPWYEMLTLMDPRQFGPGRNIKLGMKIDF